MSDASATQRRNGARWRVDDHAPPASELGVARLSAGAYLALNAGARREARRGQLVLLAAVVIGYLLGRWR